MDAYADMTGAPASVLVDKAKAEKARKARTQAQQQQAALAGVQQLANTAKTASQVDVGGGENAVAAAAGALAGAVPLTLIPTNTQSETHPIGDGLRVRTAPGQRTAAVELRVGEGFLGTEIGEKWERLPVDAEWVQEPGRPRSIAIDRRGLDAALGTRGVSMARPPSDDDKPDDGRRPAEMGHNGPPPGPLDPAPPATPIIKKSASPKPGEKENAGTTLSNEEREAIIDAAPDIATHSYQEHVQVRREFRRSIHIGTL